jgi:hypothetical protein
VGLLDVAGQWIGPDLGNQGKASPLCIDGSIDEGIEEGRPYRLTSGRFNRAQLDDLQDKTGYLVFYVVGDGAVPHLSVYVDDVVLALDLVDIELVSLPEAGPPGTEFLVMGRNLVPYNAADVYLDDILVGTAFADARGEVIATIDSTGSPPATYQVRVQDRETSPLRTATTTITVYNEQPASLGVSPPSGRPGTKFVFTGGNFRPRDDNVEIRVNRDFAARCQAMSTVRSGSAWPRTQTQR